MGLNLAELKRRHKELDQEIGDASEHALRQRGDLERDFDRAPRRGASRGRAARRGR